MITIILETPCMINTISWIFNSIIGIYYIFQPFPAIHKVPMFYRKSYNMDKENIVCLLSFTPSKN